MKNGASDSHKLFSSLYLIFMVKREYKKNIKNNQDADLKIRISATQRRHSNRNSEQRLTEYPVTRQWIAE